MPFGSQSLLLFQYVRDPCGIIVRYGYFSVIRRLVDNDLRHCYPDVISFKPVPAVEEGIQIGILCDLFLDKGRICQFRPAVLIIEGI